MQNSEMMPQTEEDEVIDDGLGIFVKQKTLYHGSGTAGIEQLNAAEEDTVGSGVYLTSEPEDAAGYARLRSRRHKESTPVVYESKIENLKLLDLRTRENVKKILASFKPKLEQQLKKEDLPWYTEAAIRQAIEVIDDRKTPITNLKKITKGFCQLFSEHIKSLGYDGLVTIEGGEGDDVGEHDTYLVIDPEKIKIIGEEKI